MLKIMLTSALLGMGAAAGNAATTINLGAMPCLATRLCFQVPNDAGQNIVYISDATQYARLLVNINGDTYDSGLWTVHRPIVNVTLHDPIGVPIVVTLSVTEVNGPCPRQGKVTVCQHTFTLNGGTIVMP